jgi:hypothetical protein
VNNEVETKMIRELTSDEVLAVAGGKICAYEAGGRCYVYRNPNMFEMAMTQINGMFMDAGMAPPFAQPGQGDPPPVS